MSSAEICGIRTRYVIEGSGPPLLMYSPGGFDARLENWTKFSIYQRLGLVEQLSQHYTCIRFDRRESGHSGGRIEPVRWADYVAQGVGLLDHLGVDRAFLMGGCVGCSSVVAFSVAHPARVRGAVLYSPAGGPRYRITQHTRFARHAEFVRAQGLTEVVALATSTDASFSKDARVGPWCSVIRTDADFAQRYAEHDPDDYLLLLASMCRVLFDRDTVPGAEAEDMLRLRTPTLIVPGQDASHAPSAAYYLNECLPGAQLWDVPVAEQTAANTPERVLRFLAESR